VGRAVSGTNALKTLLFWFTVLFGTALLAPCLVLPAWLERQAQAEYFKAEQQRVAALQQRLQMVRMQIDHLNNDPAYVLRLARQEFGKVFLIPNVETIFVEPGEAESSGLADAAVPAGEDTPPLADELLPELNVFINEAVQRYPHARLFLDDQSRPILMGVGGALLLTGVVLLGLVEDRPQE
jgi:cell division protein FtsB